MAAVVGGKEPGMQRHHDISEDHDPQQDRRAREAQEREMDAATVAPAVGAVAPSQARGAARGAALGALAGGAIGAAIGLAIDVSQLSEAAEIGVFALVGALACSVSGAVFGGGHEPDARGETPAPEER